jgi:Zn-dependent M16 (insulinase) family peptidase
MPEGGVCPLGRARSYPVIESQSRFRTFIFSRMNHMTTIKDANNPDIRQGDHVHGFKVLRVVELKQISAFFYELLHPETGASHIHISNSDAENTFGVTLKTVPKDATGVAHILEHTVLCGSKRYPVRDPFFSMLKRSLSTFMNAFTASDWTMYPFATQNAKDFYNLMDVYLDAVFFPNLNELNFKQEGHRLEFETAADANSNGRLVYKGVVYNEMKGAMSSADQVLARSLLQALYPSTTYRFNSGGDPAVIPRLTHAQLKAFHQQHYHPSNAYFYTYGNLPFADHLAFIADKVLTRYSKIDPDTDVPSQPRWDQQRQVSTAYPLSKNEDPQKKYQVCIAWLTSDIQDTFQVLVLSILEQVLLGNPASPLRKALIDSQLGTSLSDAAGYDADNRDTMFVAGLKDVAESASEAIETLIFDTLRDLAAGGIDPELIESAIHQIEFRRKEVTNTPYPYGLKQLLMMIGSWIHGGDPLSKYRLDEHLREIRARMAAGGFFEAMIRKHFLENRHRVRFVLRPDQQLEDAEKQRVMNELKNKLAELSQADRSKIEADARALAQLQEMAEDVSCLPTLEREDIPPEVETVRETEFRPQTGMFTYDQPTSGIAYISLAAGTGALEGDLMDLVPIFCYALPKIGTAQSDYVQLVQRIDRYTGGITLSAQSRTGFDDSAACVPYVLVNGKCLDRNLEPMLDIVRELVLKFDFADLQRLKNLLLEYRAALESMVVGNGHRLAISLAARHFSATRYLSEMWSGVYQLRMVKELTDDLSEKRLLQQAQRLRQIGKSLFSDGNLKIALIGEGHSLQRAVPVTERVIQSLPPGLSGRDPGGFSEPSLQWSAPLPFEGWHTSSAVSFVARAFQTVRMAHPDSPALAVISKMLRSLFLHREVREKGGAYGGFSLYNLEDGLFCYASYRDPHIAATLNVYRQADQFIRSGRFTDQDIDEAVLQVCSEIDRPDPPGPAARKAFNRRIIHLTDDARQQFKERLLAIGRRQIEAAAEAYFNSRPPESGIAVISGESQLAEANTKLDRPLTIKQI